MIHERSDESADRRAVARVWRIVTEKGSASIQELMDASNISESTVRRDLAVLDEQGRIQKVRGGAMVVGDAYSTKEDSVTQKKDKNLAEKREIAKYAGFVDQRRGFCLSGCGDDDRIDD